MDSVVRHGQSAAVKEDHAIAQERYSSIKTLLQTFRNSQKPSDQATYAERRRMVCVYDFLFPTVME